MNEREFRNKVRKSSRKRINRLAKELNDQVFKEMDCLSCAGCCKGIPPIITDEDSVRIAQSLALSKADFQYQFTTIDEDGDRVFKTSPCVFLNADNHCRIYSIRPTACREYPLIENRFVENLEYHMTNRAYCPATQEVLNRMKNSLDFL